VGFVAGRVERPS